MSSRRSSTSSASLVEMSYTQWLITPSQPSPPNRVLRPWFSAELRSADDPRLNWVDLEQLPKPDLSTTHTMRSPDLSLTEEIRAQEEVHEGHYLNHLETVQAQDLELKRDGSKSKRRSESPKSSKASKSSRKKKKLKTGQSSVSQASSSQASSSQASSSQRKRSRRSKSKKTKQKSQPKSP